LLEQALTTYEQLDAGRDLARCEAVLREAGLRRGRLLHGQAEPVHQKPDLLTAGPADQFFGPPLQFGSARVAHDSSVPFGRCRPGDRWLAQRCPATAFAAGQ
jgi:hypothetical protein